MSENPKYRLPFSPGIRLLIPLLYAAWSDRILSPSEVKALRDNAMALDFLNEHDKELLIEWTNPRRVPNRDLFKMWEIHCRQAAEQLKGKASPNLIDLGLVLADGKQQLSDLNQDKLARPTRKYNLKMWELHG